MDAIFESNSLEHFAFSIYIIFLLVDICYATFHDKEYFKETRGRVRVFVESQFWTISGIFAVYCFLKALTLFFGV